MKYRSGIPDGYARRKHVWQAILVEKASEAEKIVKHMEDTGIIPPAEPGSDESMAREALAHAVSVVRNGGIATRERLAASRLVLEFTKQKPVAKNELTLNKAEDFLAALADDMPNG